MSERDWLPPLLDVSGAREDTILRLYQVFSEDFKRTGCAFRGACVRYGSVLAGELYEESFWHIVSQERRNTVGRQLDACRAARLAWCKAVIENENDEAVSTWKDYTNRRLRTYLWLEEHDYVVVLEEGVREKLGKIASLVTAYCVEGSRGRKALRNSRTRRLSL